jgi:hypothetical protein
MGVLPNDQNIYTGRFSIPAVMILFGGEKDIPLGPSFHFNNNF